jgi:hypothetical protein
MGFALSRLGLHQGAQPILPEGLGEDNFIVTEKLDSPIGLGISGLDLPYETQPAHAEGQGESDDLGTEDDTGEPEQQSETLEVLTDSVDTSEGTIDPPPTSAFSSSSSENDEDADDEGAEEDDEEVFARAAPTNDVPTNDAPTNETPGQPRVIPYRTVIGNRDPGDDTIYRQNPWHPDGVPVPYHWGSDSDPEEKAKLRNEFRTRKVKPHKVVRPSPLRTASGPDSPTSPKQNADPTDDVGILLEPIPDLQQDEDPVSPLSDHGLTPRPQTPTPPVVPRFDVGRDWSEDDDYDDEDPNWLEAAIESVTGSRRASQDSMEQSSSEDQTPADEGDDALSDQQPLSPVSPITPVSEAENRMIVYGSDNVDETLHQPEASDYDTEYDTQTSQQTDTAPESFNPVFVGAEEHDNSEKKKSPTSPDFFGPEPLTGLTPQEGIDAFWEWRDRNRPKHRTFRTNRNPGNQNRTGDMTPTTPAGDKSEAQTYLSAQRLAAQELVNNQQRDLQAMSKRSESISEAIRFDLESALEYVKLRMLKYRYERNQYYNEAAAEYARVGRRNVQINHQAAENRELARQYEHICAEYERMEPFLQEEAEKRRILKAEYKGLKAKYQEQSEMNNAYILAAQSRGEELRHLRARLGKQAAPLQLSSIMDVFSQEPVSDASRKPESDTNEMPNSDTDGKPKSDASRQTKRKRAKRATPLQFWPISEVLESDTIQYPKSAPPTYRPKSPHPPPLSPPSPSPSYPSSRRPAPEYAANWPLADRPRLVDFMTHWINEHRDMWAHTPRTPLRKAQLDRILGVGFLSWNQLIEKLRLLGHTIRPDHLALALSDRDNIYWDRLPEPSLGVAYAARKLTKENAVRRLLEEVMALETEAWDLKRQATPADVMADLEHTKKLEQVLQQEVRELEEQESSLLAEIRALKKALAKVSGGEDLESRVVLQAELDETRRVLNEELNQIVSPKPPKSPDPWTDEFETNNEEQLALCKDANKRKINELEACHEDIERLRKALSDSTGIADFGKADQEEIQRLKTELEETKLRKVASDSTAIADLRKADQEEIQTLKTDLEEARRTLGEVVKNMDPDSPRPPRSPITNARDTLLLQDKLHACEKHGVKLSTENVKLKEDLNTVGSHVDKLTQQLVDSLAENRSLIKTSSKKIASLEAKLAAGDSSQTGNATPPSSIENELAACHEHGKLLQSNIDYLTKKLCDLGASHTQQVKKFRADYASLVMLSSKRVREAKLAAHHDDQAGDATGDQTQVEALKKKILELEQALATSTLQSEQLQAHEKELKEQLASCRSRGVKLQDHIDELELKLEEQGLLQQVNAGSSSDFLDRLKATEQHAKDLQEKVDELELQLKEAKDTTPHSSEELERQRLHSNELEKQLAACRSHGEKLQTRKDELEKQLAEAREKNEKLGLDMGFLQDDLSAAQKNYDNLREKAKSELLEEPAPASERGSGSPSQEVEDHGAPPQAERTRSASDDGSMRDPEKFVIMQSDSETGSDSSSKPPGVDLIVDIGSRLKARPRLKSRPQDASVPASERAMGSRSRGVENDNTSREGERAPSASSDGSVSDPEDFVPGQSSGESEESLDDSDLEFENALSPATMEYLERKDNRLKLEDVPDSAPGNEQDSQTDSDLEDEEDQDAGSLEASPVEPDSAIGYYTGSYSPVSGEVSSSKAPFEEGPAASPNRLPNGHARAPLFRRIDEDRDRDGNRDDDGDDDEDDCKECEERARNLVRANAWLVNDNKEAFEKIEELEKELDELKQKKPLPATSEPAPPQVPPQQSPTVTSASSPPQVPPQQSPTATETETETRTAPRTANRIPRPLPAVREPVPLPTEAPRPRETMTADQIGRRAAMYRSPSYIADADRRRGIRVRQFEREQERIRLIVRRAAAIFGEHDLPYVPVEKRYKPMVRAYM